MIGKLKPLVIRDEIHGDISFEGALRHVIDHPDFQRLRYIKQLGLAEYVFPCANHTRFQHSLGAGYLAFHYFTSILKSWSISPFREKRNTEGTVLHGDRTYACVKSVEEHVPSKAFWGQVVGMAGMLHDIGHGPYSHSFEHLRLKQDFSDITSKLGGAIGANYDGVVTSGRMLMHEDISVFYIFQIIQDLEKAGVLTNAECYFPAVAALMNRKILSPKLENEMATVLEKADLKGGVDFHRLMRPLISGPFDVDRIDYIQRDGRNCGVSIGGIEWRRIVAKVIPCLAEHESKSGEPSEVCLISNVKNQHVIDDFIFSLFQMYTQVYMHPKIVGLEEVIKAILETKGKKQANKFVMTFEKHRSLSDEKFRDLLKLEFGAPEIDDILLRRPTANFRVVSFPGESGMNAKMEAEQFSLVDTHDRPMLKDGVGVFLFGRENYLHSWAKVSPIAKQFPYISYAPEVWIRMGE